MMNDRKPNIARIDIMKQLKRKHRGQSHHLNCNGHEVPVPHLKLLVPSRHKVYAAYIAYY